MTPAEVVAVYFPSYHADPLNDRWYGPGWSEWRLMEDARPLFPGHEQPKRCAWGSFDEADPVWMERQIDLAADHGVTCFLFDWYWYSGQQFLHRALEEGFQRARNRHRLKYFVMWANHTWGVFPATRELFRGPTGTERASYGQALAYDRPLLPIVHTVADLVRVVQFCAERYFGDENYLRVEGCPVFSFWRYEELVVQLGGPAGVAAAFAAMRQAARAAGYPGLHLVINIACYENAETLHCWWPALVEQIQAAGGDAVYGYNVARTHGYAALTNDRPLVPYADVLTSHRELFQRCEGRGLPFHPTATVGFDNSPRWHRGAALPLDFRTLHYEPIVVDNPPAKFAQAVSECLASMARQGAPRWLLINAWNEWTEGNYLLPDQRYGTGYLQALKEALQP
jgi:hypothetical protein